MEFSPDLVKHRAFRYKKFLWFRVSRKETLEFRTPLERFVTDEKWVSVERKDDPRWYLIKVYGDGGHLNFRDGPIKQVCHAFGCYPADSRAWVEWSQEHPERAEKLWSKVFTLLRDERFGEAVGATFEVSDRRSTSLLMAPMHQFPPD